MRGTQFGIWHQSSWGTRWGVGGRFVIPEPAYSGPVGGWFAVRSVVELAVDEEGAADAGTLPGHQLLPRLLAR